MPQELRRLKGLLARGLRDTADVWPDVRVGYHWVHQAAHILSNQDQHEALTVQRRLGGLLGAMTRQPGGGWHACPSPGALPEGHPELLARPLCLLYGA